MDIRRLEQQMYMEPRHGAAHLPLDGGWDYTWTEKPCERPQGLDFAQHTQIPNSVYWSLYESGILPHPYHGTNSKRYDWVDKQVWYYRKHFLLREDQRTEQAFLCVGGAAYYSRVWVNGQYIGDHAGMFGGPIVQIASALCFGGENEIVLEIRAANAGGDLPAYAFQSPKNTAIVPWNIVRDSLTSNGDFTVVGLWGHVRIELLPAMHISRPYLTTTSVADGAAHLHLQLELIQDEIDELNPPRDYDSGTYGYTFAYRNGLAIGFRDECLQLNVRLTEKATGSVAYEQSHDIAPLDYSKIGIEPNQYEGRFVNLDLDIAKAKLWHPIGLGDPHLYEVSLALLAQGKELDSLFFDYGIRTFDMTRTAGEQYRARWGEFQCVVNDRPFFLKGVNWMPIDFLYREDATMYRWILDMVKDAGIQLIRIWSGGAYPESDCFYSLCDELGILVWQDHMIANMDTPSWPQDVLQAQVGMNLYRLRNHPSLVIHCGGNEFNPYSVGNAGSMFVIERNVRDLDPSRVFKRTTPDKGSAHIYRDMEPTWYRHCYGQLPFVGESGIHSFPNAKSLRQQMSPEEYARPIDDMLRDSFRQTHPELLNHFTEYVPERVPRMLARASAIADISAADMEELAEATQMASAEFYQVMIQSLRENYPVTGGMMLWVLKRAWTTVGIQLIDGLGDPIAPFYYVKNAYQPVQVQVSLPHLSYGPGEAVPLPVKVINESGKTLQSARVYLDVYDAVLRSVMHREYPVDVQDDAYLIHVAQDAYTLTPDQGDCFFFVRATLYQEGRLIHQSFYWPKCLGRLADEEEKTRYRSAPQENYVFDQGPWLKPTLERAAMAELRLAWERIDMPELAGRRRFSIRVTNPSQHPAFPVKLQVTNDGCVQHVADNYFFLAAGEARVLTLDILDHSGELRAFDLALSAWNAPKQIHCLTW